MGLRMRCCDDSLLCSWKGWCVCDKATCWLFDPFSCIYFLYFFVSINVNYVVLNCMFYSNVGSMSTFNPFEIIIIRVFIIDGSLWTKRSRSKHAHPRDLLEYQCKIYVFILGDVIWTPYIDHRVNLEFDDIVVFSSDYLSCWVVLGVANGYAHHV